MKNYFELPRYCPECDNKVKVDGKFLVCDNPECPAAKRGLILKWLDKSGMKSQGIGDKTIEKLYDAGLIVYPADLYDLQPTDICKLDGFGESSATKIVDIIQSHREVSLPQFIGGIHLKNFSTSMAELLVENGYNTLESMKQATVNRLVKVKGIERKTAQCFVDGLLDRNEVIDGLLSVGVDILDESKNSSVRNGDGALVGKSFCFTGKAIKPRKELTKLVLENGGIIKNVSMGLTYLVQADPNSESSKSKKAKKFGTEIISEEQFMEML